MAEAPDDIFSVEPLSSASQGRVLMITADGVEDLEFFYPYYRFTEAGYAVDVVTPDGKGFKGKNGYELPDAMKLSDANPNNYQMLYIPGGKAPEKLKKDAVVVEFVQEFCATGKLVGAICHGPQLLAAAGVIDGKRIAAWPECQEEVEEAGAAWQDEACVRDGQFITARWPADLPVQMKEVLEAIKNSGQEQKRAA